LIFIDPSAMDGSGHAVERYARFLNPEIHVIQDGDAADDGLIDEQVAYG